MQLRIVFMLLLLFCNNACTINTTTNHNLARYETLSEWVESPLSHSGKIYLTGNIEKTMATLICQKLIVLESDNNVSRITIYINSGGGDDDAFLAIVNTIKSLKKPVDTINQGYCMSAAAGVHQAATGKRLAYKDSFFLLHAFKSKSGSTDSDSGKVVKMVNDNYTNIIRAKSALPSEWFPISETNRIFASKEALEYKFIDEIIQ
jgi:ATP-dependent Clp protease protease subunit